MHECGRPHTARERSLRAVCGYTQVHYPFSSALGALIVLTHQASYILLLVFQCSSGKNPQGNITYFGCCLANKVFLGKLPATRWA